LLDSEFLGLHLLGGPGGISHLNAHDMVIAPLSDNQVLSDEVCGDDDLSAEGDRELCDGDPDHGVTEHEEEPAEAQSRGDTRGEAGHKAQEDSVAKDWDLEVAGEGGQNEVVQGTPGQQVRHYGKRGGPCILWQSSESLNIHHLHEEEAAHPNDKPGTFLALECVEIQKEVSHCGKYQAGVHKGRCQRPQVGIDPESQKGHEECFHYELVHNVNIDDDQVDEDTAKEYVGHHCAGPPHQYVGRVLIHFSV